MRYPEIAFAAVYEFMNALDWLASAVADLDGVREKRFKWRCIDGLEPLIVYIAEHGEKENPDKLRKVLMEALSVKATAVRLIPYMQGDTEELLPEHTEDADIARNIAGPEYVEFMDAAMCYGDAPHIVKGFAVRLKRLAEELTWLHDTIREVLDKRGEA